MLKDISPEPRIQAGVPTDSQNAKRSFIDVHSASCVAFLVSDAEVTVGQRARHEIRPQLQPPWQLLPISWCTYAAVEIAFHFLDGSFADQVLLIDLFVPGSGRMPWVALVCWVQP
jgi:hypothetical protein